jgi:hypothetical protein
MCKQIWKYCSLVRLAVILYRNGRKNDRKDAIKFFNFVAWQQCLTLCIECIICTLGGGAWVILNASRPEISINFSTERRVGAGSRKKSRSVESEQFSLLASWKSCFVARAKYSNGKNVFSQPQKGKRTQHPENLKVFLQWTSSLNLFFLRFLLYLYLSFYNSSLFTSIMFF